MSEGADVTIGDLDLPEDAVVTNSLMVVLYIDSDGNNKYALGTGGNGQMTTYVGMAATAQHRLLRWMEDQ